MNYLSQFKHNKRNNSIDTTRHLICVKSKNKKQNKKTVGKHPIIYSTDDYPKLAYVNVNKFKTDRFKIK